MNKQLVKDLERAKALIEKGWTKGVFALDGEGESVPPRSRKATKFCALGALERVTGNRTSKRFSLAADTLANALPSSDRNLWVSGRWAVMDFNDDVGRRKSQVIALFNRAIKAASQG